MLEQEQTVIWAPQEGPQMAQLQCPVFEVFYGGWIIIYGIGPWDFETRLKPIFNRTVYGRIRHIQLMGFLEPNLDRFITRETLRLGELFF